MHNSVYINSISYVPNMWIILLTKEISFRNLKIETRVVRVMKIKGITLFALSVDLCS